MSKHSVLVASLLVLRQKVHSFHWSVTGGNFMELHKLFQSQYEELLSYSDRIAEYIRSKEEYPPVTLNQMIDLSIISEEDASVMNSIDMLQSLYTDISSINLYAGRIAILDPAWGNIQGDLSEYLGKQSWFIMSYLK